MRYKITPVDGDDWRMTHAVLDTEEIVSLGNRLSRYSLLCQCYCSEDAEKICGALNGNGKHEYLENEYVPDVSE